MHPDEKIRNIHERVKYLKRDRKLEAGYMTMEEYIREEAERRAKLMASSTEYIVISSRTWNYSGRTAAAHRRRTG